MTTIKVAEVLSTDIRCRDNAEVLKALIVPGDDIALDFSDVTFISRAFADELYTIIERSPSLLKSAICVRLC
jgi:hypothetical protein